MKREILQIITLILFVFFVLVVNFYRLFAPSYKWLFFALAVMLAIAIIILSMNLRKK